MHKLLFGVGLAVASFVGAVHAQFCPGVSPWVFDDVLANDQFCPNITWMALNNITLGCKTIGPFDRDYCPNDSVTRKQMAAFMNRLGNIRVQEVDTGPGLTGGPITLTGTIGLAATQLLPTAACANGQVPKWNGANWTCATIGGGTGTVTSVAAGTGLVASPSPITTTGTLNVASSYQLPQGCGNGQVAKSNGAGGWTCAADANSGGTVMSITAGAGLLGGTIYTSGTIAVDPASATLTGNFFKQGGNTFGTTAKLGTLDNQPLEIYASNQRVVRYEPNATSPNVIGGHPNNSTSVGSLGGTIGGGGKAGANCLDPITGTNTRSCSNHTDFTYATIGGGFSNAAGFAGTVAGGFQNTASGGGSAVGGGTNNTASGPVSTVVGGENNYATGGQSVIAGGSENRASGNNSFAAGHFATADQNNCAVFGLWSTLARMTCLGNTNVFRIGGDHGFSVDYYTQRPDGGGNRWVYIGDIFGFTTITAWNGAFLSDAGVWVNAASAAERKTDFARVDSMAVLQKVASLPITTWRYKEGEGNVRHIGPMAEDFWKAFAVGYGPQTIADLDARGVELTAIQGLHLLMQEKDREIAELRERMAQVESLRGELAALRNAIAAATKGANIAREVNATAP